MKTAHKTFLFLSVSLLFFAASCKETSTVPSKAGYSITCNPDIEITEAGAKLTPNIVWNSTEPKRFSYRATLLYQESNSGIYKMGMELDGGMSVASKDWSSTTVPSKGVVKLLVLVEVHDQGELVDTKWFRTNVKK